MTSTRPALTRSTTPLADAARVGWEAGHLDGWEEGYRRGFEAGAEVGGERVLRALRSGWPDLGPARRLVSREYVDLLDGAGIAAPCTCSCCERWRSGRGS